MKEIGAAVSDEMGAPLPMAERLQAGAGLGHIAATLDVLKNYHFEETVGSAVVVREPVGVIGMITPWNWPLNQIACKVAPALAAGCTMILKPSEFTPTSALIFAEILHEAGVPKGVFNLINGDGPEVGAAMSEHPGHRHDLVHRLDPRRHRWSPSARRRRSSASARSWAASRRTSSSTTPISTKAVTGGVDAHVQQLRPVVQRADAHDRAAVEDEGGRRASPRASPTRPRSAIRRAEGTTIGPVVNRGQCDKIQGLIQKGIEEGATLVTGGPGLPEGVNTGFYVRPTVFADVTERHDHRARGDLRAGARDHRRTRTKTTRSGSPTTRPTASPATSRPTPSSTPARSAAQIRAGNVNLQRRAASTAPRRSAATSSPATAANGANTASRNSSRSRRSPASTPRRLVERQLKRRGGISSCSGVLRVRSRNLAVDRGDSGSSA